ncbi:glutathione-dependent formaldehyde dehydrogenase [Talaromyces stipitatus ATCC 10500]|uniref:Glutathione-dependent formaldehyde dehydrogenase n=1 Tax=Talaromyces stipitatus (strain ATCC 10500 / CBS 375.48 / QM 6759 / NRRL 1006) TaxID=441959 RepID=B8M9N8_TALSN|nr:glutathione-dependent formaldehyde dehydrogenase [Talaromyces stipitatus ATCC 10500]EED18040.1 glutathione-dependent formaldehyde dehydrogenase [Talaromyces stipitatus ATCC 10500]
MAFSQPANLTEKVLPHEQQPITEHVSNYSAEEYGDHSQLMKALVWNGKYNVKVVDTPKPKIIDDRDVIIKVTGSTICGSDLHMYHGVIPEMQKGDILGHEFCGVVESVGPKATKYKPGDRVVASFQIACGECYYCKKGLSSVCEKTNSNELANKLYGRRTAGIFGYSHLTGGFAGGQAEWVRVPYGDVNLLKLPDDVPDEKGLYLSDVLGTSWNAVVDTGVEEGDTVAIWGAGPIGQMVAEFSFFNGAKRVILIDGGSGAWRLEFVKKLLPNLETINFTDLPKGESVTSQLKKMCHGRGPDVAIECAAGEYAQGWQHYFETLLGLETDTSELLNEMITSVRAYGRCGITGVYAGYCNHFNIGSLMQTGVRLIGNGQAPIQKYWEHLLKLIQEDKIKPLDMVTHRFDVTDMDKVYGLFDKRQPGIQKVFIQTRHSAPPASGAPQLTKL